MVVSGSSFIKSKTFCRNTSLITSSFHCANLRKWESVRTRCMVPYEWDIFVFEWGGSPYRPVPYRSGITVHMCCYERPTCRMQLPLASEPEMDEPSDVVSLCNDNQPSQAV